MSGVPVWKRAQFEFNYIFKLRDGSTLEVHRRNAQRVIDRRGMTPWDEVVWEVKLSSGAIRRFWPEDILEFDQVPV